MWVGLNAAALTLMVVHVLIDWQIGLFGPSSLEMWNLQAGAQHLADVGPTMLGDRSPSGFRSPQRSGCRGWMSSKKRRERSLTVIPVMIIG